MTLLTDASKHPNIQAAINAAGSFVYIPNGKYTENIICKSGVDVRLSKGATLKGTVTMKSNVCLSGGRIEGNVILLGADKFSLLDHTVIRDLSLVGTGAGISMTSGAGAGEKICGVRVQNVTIAPGFDYPILLQSVGSGGGSYINANSFRDVVIYGGAYAISLLSDASQLSEVSGNVFSNIMRQVLCGETGGIRVTGQAQYNSFEYLDFDWGSVNAGKVLTLDDKCYYNRAYLAGNISAMHVTDGGAGNIVTLARGAQ